MQPEKHRSRSFTRRAALLGGAKLALFAGLGARMYYLQVLFFFIKKCRIKN